jgi:hypothetical protein
MMSRWTIWFLTLGAISGVLAASSTLYPLADVSAPPLFGYCFGIATGSQCGGISGSLYLFPGLIFGVAFGGVEYLLGRLGLLRAVVFAVISGIANAIATFLCIWLFGVFGEAIEVTVLDLPLALAGAVSGAVGGAMLAGVAAVLVPGAKPGRPIVVAAVLGLLVPFVTETELVGVFAFYIIWQAGFAAALAAGWPAEA